MQAYARAHARGGFSALCSTPFQYGAQLHAIFFERFGIAPLEWQDGVRAACAEIFSTPPLSATRDYQ